MPKEKSKNLPVKQKEPDNIFSTKEYETTLADLKKHIRSSQLKAAVVVNKELIKLYWIIGKTIVEK